MFAERNWRFFPTLVTRTVAIWPTGFCMQVTWHENLTYAYIHSLKENSFSGLRHSAVFDIPAEIYVAKYTCGILGIRHSSLFGIRGFPIKCTVCQKGRQQTCGSNYEILTDFQNSFTVRLSSKLAVKWLLKIPPYLKLVATLPCEICFLQIATLNSWMK